MALPLVARQHKLGLIVLSSAESGHIYNEADLKLAQELATRAALAVDNARLYEAELKARAQAEAALRARDEGERQLRAILEHTPAVIYVADRDARLVLVNREYERRTGHTAAQLIGRVNGDLLPPEQARAVLEHDLGVMRNNRAIQFESSFLENNGRRSTFFSLKFPLVDETGAVCGVGGISTDITERKQAEEALKRVQKMEALGRLAGGIAHDFNNILTAISGYAGLVRDCVAATSPARSSVEHIQRAAARATALTQQLLVFGRQRIVQPEVIDLSVAVRNLLAMLRRLIDEDVCFETALDPDAGAVVIEQAQLEQVILNLTLNARDAMPEGGRLRIATGAERSDEGMPLVRLTVEDDGVGMDPETRARIFEPFFTTKEVGKGTGLGLATVYSIVEQAGGRILVDSQPGRGARFDVLWPRSDRPRAAARPERDAVVRPGAGQTLLVVEDDESVCEFVSLVLCAAGYTVLTAHDGDDAIRIAAEHAAPIDLLVTDIVMPNRNGRSLASELRRARPDLRVMYMSGYPGDTLERYESIPPNDTFLQKPFDRELLCDRVADALRPRR
jgi:PAS domain S-box-containing protein